MSRRRSTPADGQLTLDAALRAVRRYPEALRLVATRTGDVLAVLPGGATPTPAPVVALARHRRVA